MRSAPAKAVDPLPSPMQPRSHGRWLANCFSLRAHEANPTSISHADARCSRPTNTLWVAFSPEASSCPTARMGGLGRCHAKAAVRRGGQGRHRLPNCILDGAAAWPLAACAQQPAPNAVRIGWLKIQGPRHTLGQLQAFREGMRALGLVEGRDYLLEERYADGHESQLPTLTAELLGTGVRIIVATSQPSIIAAARVTKGVPIIGRMVDDPVTTGLGRSLARPGGNITGIYTMTEEMNPKRLDLLKEVVPSIRRVGVLLRDDFPNVEDAEHSWQVTVAAAADEVIE